jgi:DNA-binding IclR family transcriptional regulator
VLPLDRGASSRLLLATLPPGVRREYLAPLAERDPEAAARLEGRIDHPPARVVILPACRISVT